MLLRRNLRDHAGNSRTMQGLQVTLLGDFRKEIPVWREIYPGSRGIFPVISIRYSHRYNAVLPFSLSKIAGYKNACPREWSWTVGVLFISKKDRISPPPISNLPFDILYIPSATFTIWKKCIVNLALVIVFAGTKVGRGRGLRRLRAQGEQITGILTESVLSLPFSW